MGDNKDSTRKEDGLSSGKVAVANSAQALLDNLIASAQKLEASSIHVYSTSKSRTCYFEVAGRLETTGKKFNDKILQELVDFIKSSTNLEKSELIQAQTSKLSLDGEDPLSVVYLQSPEDGSSHLILGLDNPHRPKAFEDLGLWGKSLEQLESVLDSRKGIIIIDSKDPYALRSLINSCLNYLKQDHRLSLVSFDSSLIPDPKLRNHDRIFTKLGPESVPLAKQVLNSSPAVVAFLDTANVATLDLAVEQSQSGKLVFVVTSEGSVSTSLKKILSLNSKALEEVRLAISASPIQSIGASNGRHELNAEILSQLEIFFGMDLPESWRSIYLRAGIKTPEELLHLQFPLASEYGGLTNIVEALCPTDYIKRSLTRTPGLSSETVAALAAQSGMLSKREDGLIKALRKEVDLADVIDVCR